MSKTIVIKDVKGKDIKDISLEVYNKILNLNLNIDSLIIQLPINFYFLDEEILNQLGKINIFTTNTMEDSDEIIVIIKEKDNYKIAIDGPSASGKSTIAKALSKILGIDYLDTGSMYRAITYYLLKEKIDLNNQYEVENSIDNITMEFYSNSIVLNNKVLKDELRTEIVTNNVSLVSSYSSVRKKLVTIQRNIAKNNSIILDGRDIGTVVFPNAEYKFYLIASPEERAKRRLEDSSSKLDLDYNEILKDIKRRDYLDMNRKISPLKKADDAILIDSSKLSINEVIEVILNEIRGI